MPRHPSRLAARVPRIAMALVLASGAPLALATPNAALAQEAPLLDVQAPAPLIPAPQDNEFTPLDAAGFDAYVTGRTIGYESLTQAFGIEEYLPGRRVRWQFTQDVCRYGHWSQQDDAICFFYEEDPEGHCWHFWLEGGRLQGLSTGGDTLITEAETDPAGLSCPPPLVGV